MLLCNQRVPGKDAAAKVAVAPKVSCPCTRLLKLVLLAISELVGEQTASRESIPSGD
jgi:hypothetical protein